MVSNRDNGGLFITTASALLVFVAAGCSNPTTSNRLPEVQDLAAQLSSSDQTLTFDEGTNMALARNPINGQLIVSIQGTLFSVPESGGPAQAITDYYQDAREPQVATDGTQVVYQGYAGGTWDIYSLQLQDGSIKALTQGPFDDREPVFAPDQRSIVFSSDRSGNYDLWQLNLETNVLKAVTQTPQDEYAPSFLNNGTTIAYALRTARDQSELRLLDLTSQDADPVKAKSQVLLRETGIISGVSVAPDNSRVAYQLLRRDRAGEVHTELRTVGLSNTLSNTSANAPTPQSLTPVLISRKGDDVFPFRAAWRPLPDAESGATNPQLTTNSFALIASVNGKLQRYDDNQTGEPKTIEFTASLQLNRKPYKRKQRDYSPANKRALGIYSPALSSSGQQVAFTALGDLWQWDFATDELRQLTDDRFAKATPVYSPDNKHIAYVSDRNGTSQLWIYHLADNSAQVLNEDFQGVSFPSWSPDGNHIAFFGELPANPLGGQLILVDINSGVSRTLGSPTSPQPLSWSKDGAHLAAAALSTYSNRYREGVYELLVFSVASSDGKAIARIKTRPHSSALDIRLTPDGKGVGYVQGGLLYYQPIDLAFQPTGEPRQISSEIADMPAWSGDGKTVLALSGNVLRRFAVATGNEIDARKIPLNYSRKIPQQRWTLRTSRLFNGNTPGYQKNLDIIINGNRIEALTARSDSSPNPIVDVSQHSVIPGLFEMHAHMGNLREPQGRTWLAYGITTVRDPGSNPYLAKERQEAWDSGRRPGPRTHITGYLTDGNRVFYSIAESLDANTLDVALERTKALELDFIKTYVRLSDTEQRKVVAFAHDLGIPTSSHELFPAAAHGMDHVEHIGGTSRRGYQPKVSSLGYSYADVTEILTASNMGLTATAVLPAWSVIFREDKDLFDTPTFKYFYGPDALKNYEGLARRFGGGAKTYHKAAGKLLRTLVARDALLVTGTDSPFVPYGTGLHAELRLYDRAGLEPWQVLRAATAKAAEAAGVDNELGNIAPGMLADLVVVAGDPLKQIKDADNVVLTIKGGHRYPIESLLSNRPNQR